MTEQADPKWAWKDGQFIPYNDCTLHVRTLAVMVAASVFEGIKAYRNNADGSLHLFRAQDHIDRLSESMKIMRMTSVVPADLERVCAELLIRNEVDEDAHIVPTAYVGGSQGKIALGKPLTEGLFITGIARGRSPILDKGLHVCVSSWTRISDNSVPPRVKAAGNYQNGRLALNEAWANGYDYTLLLNSTGTVSEGPGACMMMVRRGLVCTPPTTAGILESITRDTLITLFREKLGMEVVERPIDRTELYTADEIFMCGSGMEVVPVMSVDRFSVGNETKGPLTKAIQDAYFAVATGADPSHSEWRTPVRSNR